jgi:excisionase family DNA binding protein
MVYLLLGCSRFRRGTPVPKDPSPKPVQRKFATIPETCLQINVGRTTVYGLIEDGTLRRVKIGARALIPQADIDAFVAGLLDGDVAS